MLRPSAEKSQLCIQVLDLSISDCTVDGRFNRHLSEAVARTFERDAGAPRERRLRELPFSSAVTPKATSGHGK